MSGQKSFVERYFAGKTTTFDEALWNNFVREVDARYRELEGIKIDWESVSDQGIQVALDRINEVLLPASDRIRRVAELGFLTAPSATAHTLEVGQTLTFVVSEGDQRDLFTPSPFVAITRGANATDYAIGRALFYNPETGQLDVRIDAVFGDPGPHSDWFIAAVAGSVSAQVELLADAQTARTVAETARAGAETARAGGETARAGAETAQAVAETARAGAETARGGAETARAGAEAALEEFQGIYYGPRDTEPAGAALGAQYLDTSQTPNLVKVLTETGWAPTVTISIGGSRQQVYVATAGQTGPFTVDGGFSNGSVNVNGVELFHGHGVTLNAGAGTFTLSQGRSAGDVVVFRGYLANDAADIYVKSEADQRFVSGKQAQAFTAAEQGRARGNVGGDLLGGFRNKLINGDFDLWQRGTAFAAATSSRYTADRWRTNHSGGTIGVSRQTFASGHTDVPGNPRFFARIEVTAGNDFCGIMQLIENIHLFSGKRVTVSFWAKGTNPGGGKLYTYLYQSFGAGGSTAIDSPKKDFALTPSWQKFSLTIDVPSIAGKTLGTDPYSALVISQAEDLSAAAWTLDLAHVSLVEGDATAEGDPFSPRHIQQELDLCQRYFNRLNGPQGLPGFWNSGTQLVATYMPPVPMRVKPTVSTSTPLTSFGTQAQSATITAIVIDTVSTESNIGLNVTCNASSAALADGGALVVSAGTYIDLDAEL